MSAARTRRPRRSHAPETVVTKTIGADDVAESGKKNPASGKKSEIMDEDEKGKLPEELDEAVVKAANSKFYVPIMKKDQERRTITGVVLEPDTIDAHGDTIPAEVILNAAEDFLAAYNKSTELGVQHKEFGQPIELVQSWVVPDQDIVINSVLVKKGSWVITVRVNDDEIWDKVKAGKLTGFSIGGKAKVMSLIAEAA